jgi:hypothetical protein
LSLEEGVWKEEAVWNGRGATGSGCSELFEAPRWQLGTAAWPSVECGDKRAVADVSADADPYTGAAIYSSECAGHWCTFGGTSLASPLIAAVFALAGGANGVEYPASTLYANEAGFPGGLHDVVAGSNGKCPGPVSAEDIAGCSIETEAASCSGHAICLAGIGYDGPSGVGTPDGIAAFQPFPEGAGRSATAGSGDGSGSPEGARNHSTTSASQNATAGTSPPGSRASSRPGSIDEAATRISGLRLTPHTITARSGIRPKASQVGFSFTVNVAAPVRATLARRSGARGHRRWKLLPDSLTILARGGHNSGNLRGRNTLAPGAYRLTLTPAHGTGQSILITIR